VDALDFDELSEDKIKLLGEEDRKRALEKMNESLTK
jgi:hypothetical protein